MGLKFSIPYQIPFYETNITHQVKLPHLLAFSLQVSGMQSESLGDTDKEVFDKYGLVWIVTDYAIEIDRLPRYNEKVTITTEAVSYNKIFCYRNFYITDETGQQIMLFKTTFALMDYETRKINTASHYDECGGFYVTKYQLDTNYHVNNAWYIQIAQEYLPDDFVPAMIRVDYKMPAVYGDKIYPYIGWTDEGRIQIDLRDGLNKTYALVEFAEA